MSYCRPDRLDTDEAQDLIGWFAHNLPVELRGKLMAERPLAYVKLFGTGCARATVEHVEAAVQPCMACHEVRSAMIHRRLTGRPGEFVRKDGHDFAPFPAELEAPAEDVTGRLLAGKDPS